MNYPVLRGLVDKLKHRPEVVVHFRPLFNLYLPGLGILFVVFFHLFGWLVEFMWIDFLR